MSILIIAFGIVSAILTALGVFGIEKLSIMYLHFYPLFGLIFSVILYMSYKRLASQTELNEHKEEIKKLKKEIQAKERRIAEDLTTYGNSEHFKDPDNEPMDSTKAIKYPPEFDKKDSKE